MSESVDTEKEFYLVYVHGPRPGGLMSSDQTYCQVHAVQGLVEARGLADTTARQRGCRVYIAKVVEWSEVPVEHRTFGGSLAQP